MLALVLMTALSAESALEPRPEPFLDTGGVHLVCAHGAVATLFAVMFFLYSGDNGTPPSFASVDLGWRVAGAAGIALHGVVSALLMGRYLRPSIASAWLSAFTGFAGLFAGFAAATQVRRPRAPGTFTTDPDLAVGVALGAAIGTVASLFALVPRDREVLSWRTALVVTGATVTTTGVVLAVLASQGRATTDPYRQVGLVVPVAVALLLRLSLGAVAPEPWITPDGGAGLTMGGRF